jgi:hypothetical protein
MRNDYVGHGLPEAASTRRGWNRTSRLGGGWRYGRVPFGRCWADLQPGPAVMVRSTLQAQLHPTGLKPSTEGKSCYLGFEASAVGRRSDAREGQSASKGSTGGAGGVTQPAEFYPVSVHQGVR